MQRVSPKTALVAFASLLLLGLGIAATSLEWWRSAAVAALIQLWLISLVVVHHRQATVGHLRRLLRRIQSLEGHVEALRESERKSTKKSLGKHLRIVRGAISARLDEIEADLTAAARSLETASKSALEIALSGGEPTRQSARQVATGNHVERRDFTGGSGLPSPTWPPNDTLLTQMDALREMQQRYPMDPEPALTSVGGPSPLGLLQLMDLVSLGCDLVVECGAGPSTIYLGRALKEAGRGRLVALEHRPDVARSVQVHAERQGLTDAIEVRLTELVSVDVYGGTHSWYEETALQDLRTIDLLRVGGPNGTHDLARLPALRRLGSKLRWGALVILNDAQRDGEKEVAHRWLNDPRSRLAQIASRTPDQCVFRWQSPVDDDPLGQGQA
jgi:hypothetical protein